MKLAEIAVPIDVVGGDYGFINNSSVQDVLAFNKPQRVSVSTEKSFSPGLFLLLVIAWGMLLGLFLGVMGLVMGLILGTIQSFRRRYMATVTYIDGTIAEVTGNKLSIKSLVVRGPK